jgi:hypothetical protein
MGTKFVVASIPKSVGFQKAVASSIPNKFISGIGIIVRYKPYIIQECRDITAFS